MMNSRKRKKVGTNINELIIELLQLSLGTRERLSRVPSEREWELLLIKAEEQAVVGVVFSSMECLPITALPPSKVKYQWIGEVQLIEQQNRVHQAVITKTEVCLKNGGVPVAFMKGQVCGTRYPMPERRSCGDIDFVVAEKDFAKTLDLLESIGTVDRNLVHEHHGMAFVDFVTLEPHYKVHNFQNPDVDKAMGKLLMEVFPRQLVSLDLRGEKIPVFPAAFECALLVGHMVNHVYAEGLGLRQVIDFMMFLQKEYEAVRSEDCQRYLRMMKMERSFRVFVRICEEYLGMSPTLLCLVYSAKEKQFAKKMMDDVLKVGNFGRGARNLGGSKCISPFRSYLWVVGRCCKLGYLCPAEARWWPVSKFCRYFWKKRVKRSRNGYFFQNIDNKQENNAINQ